MAYLRAGLIGFHNVVTWPLAGLMLAVILLGLKAQSARYLRPFPGGFALCRPWEANVILGLVGLMSLLPPLLLLSDDLWHGGNLQHEDWTLWGSYAGIFWPGAIFLFWQSSPRELTLNETQRTYRQTEGWPPFRQVSAGPFFDLSGVWAERDTDGNNYLVYVGWQNKRGKMLVEQFSSSLEGAQYFAGELAATLGIPCLDRDPSAPSLPYRVPADLQRPQWIVQDGRTVLFQE